MMWNIGSLLATALAASFDIQEALGDAWGRVQGWMEGLIKSLPNVIGALVVLVAFWVLARVVRKLVGKLAGRMTIQREVTRLVAGAVYIGVLAIGLVLALGVLELDKTVTSLLAGAGIVGLALGFAFQDIAENFIAGIILNVRNQFNEGDIIETNNFMGVVERVQLRATVMRTFPGQRVLIPNAQIFKNPILNYTQLGQRRVDIPVGVAYGDDLDKARRVAVAAGCPAELQRSWMRHSRIELTMNLYTDPVLLDVAGAVKALPTFVPDQPGPASRDTVSASCTAPIRTGPPCGTDVAQPREQQPSMLPGRPTGRVLC